MPKELIAAQRGSAERGQGVSEVGISSRVPASEMCGLSLVKVDLGWHRFSAQRQHGLDEADHSCGCFKMTNVCFDGTEQARRDIRMRPAKSRRDRFDLDRIAKGGACSMCLDESRSDAAPVEHSRAPRGSIVPVPDRLAPLGLLSVRPD